MTQNQMQTGVLLLRTEAVEHLEISPVEEKQRRTDVLTALAPHVLPIREGRLTVELDLRRLGSSRICKSSIRPWQWDRGVKK